MVKFSEDLLLLNSVGLREKMKGGFWDQPRAAQHHRKRAIQRGRGVLQITDNKSDCTFYTKRQYQFFDIKYVQEASENGERAAAS